tara:strand:- start:615 stop:1058 length:444 start_codon:yes stop_codon:yes gene_type:complete
MEYNKLQFNIYSLANTNKRILGRVKWFNSKLGYGFITHKKDNKNIDIFVHWSNLELSENEYHTLYKGEFVEFQIESCICKSNINNNQSIQACKVSGPNNSQLLTSVRENIHNKMYKSTQIFNVRQLDVSEFSTLEHLSKKAHIYYNS